MSEGRIVKGVGGLYFVAEGHELYSCRARGLFRLKKITPAIGDRVIFEKGADDQEGRITDILPRTSLLKRPVVANVDLNVVVIAAGEPVPDLLLVDRLLAQAQEAGIEASLCINKADQADRGLLEGLQQQYRHLPSLFVTTDRKPDSILPLAEKLQGRVSCFSGQSGVGKSTLINLLSPSDEAMETGEISGRTRRGKHTTRHVELRTLESGGYIMDTPGFSLLEMDLMDPERLADFYPDFAPYREQCRFVGCVHLHEPDCCVKEAVARGEIDRERYDRYRLLLEDLKSKWRNRYD